MSADHLPAGRQYIHYDPDRVDFSITGEELGRFESASTNLWKDACLVSVPLGLSCIVNAIANTTDPFVLTAALFLNYLIGVLGLALAVVFGIAWYRTHTGCTEIIAEIKRKPKMQISVPSTFDVGSLPTAAISPTTGGIEQKAD